METYGKDELNRLLERRRSGGSLSLDQMRALVAWSGTSEEERPVLQAEIDEKDASAPLPGAPPIDQRAHLEKRGTSAAASARLKSLVGRIRAFVGRR